MDEDIRNGEDSGPSSAVGRRRVLKGAVAAGVGVAAWSSPSITSLGGTPVYAAACTQPVFEYQAGFRNTDCGGCGGSSIRYKDWSTKQCPGSLYPFSVTLTDSGGTPPAGGSGLCPPAAHGSVGGVPAGQTCVLRVSLVDGNCSGATYVSATSAPFTGPATVQLPALACPDVATANIFTKVEVVCSTQSACLP